MAMVSSSSRKGNGSYTITTYKCKLCSLSFNSEAEAKAHVRSQHAEEFRSAYQCKKCGERFPSEQEAQTHVGAKHPEALYSYQCKLCQNKFPSEDAVREHLRTSHPETTQEGTLSCPLCGERFKSSEQHQIVIHIMQRHPEMFQKIKSLAEKNNDNSSSIERMGPSLKVTKSASSNQGPINDSGTNQTINPDSELQQKKPWWKFWQKS